MTETKSLKAHIALNVRKLERSIEFYQKLFDIQPSKAYEQYAKFDVQDPPLNLTLNEREFKDRGALFHMGIQVTSTEAVLAFRERWRLAGLETRDEMQIVCGHALQDKTWVVDPDGINWEVFVVHKDKLPMFSSYGCAQDQSHKEAHEISEQCRSSNTNKSPCTASTDSDLVLRKLTEKDWKQVRTIYEEGISTGDATFQQAVPSWELWDRSHLADCRLVALQDENIVGWTALSLVSERCVYSGVGEVSVYVSAANRGQGIGKALLSVLITESESAGIWTLQAGIFPENVPSVALHKGCGFREVGRRERIGNLKGVWRDTLLLERRSKSVGIDDKVQVKLCAS